MDIYVCICMRIACIFAEVEVAATANHKLNKERQPFLGFRLIALKSFPFEVVDFTIFGLSIADLLKGILLTVSIESRKQ